MLTFFGNKLQKYLEEILELSLSIKTILEIAIAFFIISKVVFLNFPVVLSHAGTGISVKCLLLCVIQSNTFTTGVFELQLLLLVFLGWSSMHIQGISRFHKRLKFHLC